MTRVFGPLEFLLLCLAGWLNQRERQVNEYLRAENRIFREQLGKRRLRLTDDQRRRLAVLGKEIGRKALQERASIVTPDTILRWHRKLIARKWDFSRKRGPGRPPVILLLRKLVVRMATENPRWGYDRRTLRPHHQGRVPEPPGLLQRAVTSLRDRPVRRALPSGTAAPGTRESNDRPAGASTVAGGLREVQAAAWRTPVFLRAGRRLSE